MVNRIIIQAVKQSIDCKGVSISNGVVSIIDTNDNFRVLTDTENNDVNAKVAELEAQAEIEAKYKAIEDAIYKFYPAKQQAQDEKWVSSYTTKLKAQGVADLEVQIVTMVTSFFSGATLSEVIADVDDEQKPLFEKLVKVGIRTEWAELCVTEGKSAIAENREPVYPEFPVIN